MMPLRKRRLAITPTITCCDGVGFAGSRRCHSGAGDVGDTLLPNARFGSKAVAARLGGKRTLAERRKVSGTDLSIVASPGPFEQVD